MTRDFFWYFLKSSLNDKPKKDPILLDEFIGDVGDYYEIDGVGYIITDFVVESKYIDTEVNERW